MSHAILSKKKLVPPLDGMSDNDDKSDIYTDYSYSDVLLPPLPLITRHVALRY